MRPALREVLRPFSPIVRTIREYRPEDFPRDLVAGITVSVVDLPQSMAFAVIAGVPPVYGLYTAIFLAFLGALFTSSRFLSVGPTNTQSLLIAAIVSRLTADPQIYLQLVIGLSLIKGLIQLAFAAARMGRLVRYVSQSVMIGFTAGAGILIFAEQIPAFLGFHAERGPDRWPGVLEVFHRLIAQLADVSPEAAVVGGASLLVLIVCRRISERLPAPLLAVAVGAVLVWLTGWTGVPAVGELPRGLPHFRLPRLTWLQAESLLPGAVAIALLGMIESVAIAKSIAQRTGQAISADQEFFGQGFANCVGSFFQCIPGSGSFSRTALQYVAGARTRVAGVICALFNAAFFLALAPLAAHIPLASLAAILFVVAYSLVDGVSILRIVRTSPSDAVVSFATLASALLVPLTYAIYIGIFLSIALYLRQASRLNLLQTVLDEGEEFQEHPVRSMGEHPGEVIFLQLQGDLFFGVTEELANRLRELVRSDARVAIFRLRRTQSIDTTVLFTFERFIKAMQERGAHVIFCGVPPELRRSLRAFGIERLIGEEQIFESGMGVFGSAKRALQRAKELLDVHPESGPRAEQVAEGEGTSAHDETLDLPTT